MKKTMNVVQKCLKSIWFIYYFVLCNITIDKETNKVKTTVWNLLATTIIALTVISVAIISTIISFLRYDDSDLSKIVGVIKICLVFQAIYSILTYFISVINSLCNTKNHAALLMKIFCFDKMYQRTFSYQINSPKLSLLRNIFLMIYFFGVVFANIFLQKGYIFNFMYTASTSYIALSFALIIMYIRSISEMLLTRFNALHQQLHKHFYYNGNEADKKTMNLLYGMNQLWKLKEKLGKCFGTSILLSTIFDFLTLTITFYIVFWKGYTEKLTMSLLSIVVVYIIPHATKNLFVISSLTSLSTQVIKTIYFN